MISLIATVLNEGHSMHRLMRSLLTQTRLPDEMVIVDGGSTDDTVAIIQGYANRLPLRVLVEPGCNISAGRNRAIAAAQGDIITVTDAGVEAAPDWLDKITRPLVDNPTCLVVGGFFKADYTTLFELAMSATALPLPDEINPATFLPSSRSVAFRKTAWKAVDGYPEWLDYCEDLVFDLRLKAFLSRQSPVVSLTPPPSPLPELKEGESYPFPMQETKILSENGSFVFVPEAVVAFRPRGSLRSFFNQYYLYARGDGKADLWRKRHAARYLAYGVALPVIFLLGVIIHPLLWLLLLPAGYVYMRQPYRRLGTLVTSDKLQVASDEKRNSHFGRPYSLSQLAYLGVVVLFIRVVGDIAKMLGYPVGWLWRLRMHPADWKHI